MRVMPGSGDVGETWPDREHRENGVDWMRNPTAEFFDGLRQVGPNTLSKAISATIRIDLAHRGGRDCWFLALDGGRIRVSHEDRTADCVVRTEAALFDRLVTGEANLVAALLRNQITVEGDVALNILLRRLLPGPPGAHDSRVAGR